MNDKYLHTLEFDKILNRLAAHAAFSASEELARSLTPSTNAEEIAARHSETTEAGLFLDQHSDMGVGGARDLRPLTRNARIGAVLTPMDLLEVRQTLMAARTLRRSLTRLQALYPRLAARAALLEELPVLVDAIGRAINDRGEVADTASDELARIRGELNVIRSRLMDRLQRILTSPNNAKIIQEPIITQRDGRYVIPLRAEAKGRLPGVVHDTSASGATLGTEASAASPARSRHGRPHLGLAGRRILHPHHHRSQYGRQDRNAQNGRLVGADGAERFAHPRRAGLASAGL